MDTFENQLNIIPLPLKKEGMDAHYSDRPKNNPFATKKRVIRPTWAYSVFSSWKPLLVMATMTILAMFYPLMGHLLYTIVAGSFLWATYRILYIRSKKFEIDKEQIIYSRGIFNIDIDFLELYRVKDFKIRKSFGMRLIKAMKITLITSERDSTEFLMSGIKSSNITFQLRELVEWNRSKKNVYEVD